MSPRTKKTATFILRWGIAVVGVWYVLAKTSFEDRVLLVDAQTNQPHAVRVLNDAKESDTQFEVFDPNSTPQTRVVPRSQVWIKPDGSTFEMKEPDGTFKKVKLLAVLPGEKPERPAALIINRDGKPQRIDPSQIPSSEYKYTEAVPYPRVDIGLDRLVRGANPWFLLLALSVLPISFVITSRRWHMLLELLEIRIGQWRTFVICMVGAFYSTFMPGSTGGDLVKAYYAAKHTTHRTRAVMSVLIDRILGLLALIILGGIMASLQFNIPECRRVAIGCWGLLAITVIGALLFYHPGLHKAFRVDWILARLPLQRQVHNGIEALHLYGHAPVRSDLGRDHDIPSAHGHHHLRIFRGSCIRRRDELLLLLGGGSRHRAGGGGSHQSAGGRRHGVFRNRANARRQGVPTSQAIALAMSIRFGAVFWNLLAGIFVLRGGYHARTKNEAQSLEDDEGTVADSSLAPA